MEILMRILELSLFCRSMNNEHVFLIVKSLKFKFFWRGQKVNT